MATKEGNKKPVKIRPADMASETERTEYQEEYETEGAIDEYGSQWQSDFTQAVEEEEMPVEEELFSYLGDVVDGPEEKRLYTEYLSLLKSIQCQNEVVDNLKKQILEKCGKECKTRCEYKEIQNLHCCMEQENLKLHCLIQEAVKLQNFGSKRRWGDVPLATTLDEDNLNLYESCLPPCGTTFGMPQQDDDDKDDDDDDRDQDSDPCIQNKQKPCRKPCSKPCKKASSKSCKDMEREKSIRSLCNALVKMKICSPDDKKLIKALCTQLLCEKPSQPTASAPCSKGRLPMRRSKSMQRLSDPCEPVCSDSTKMDKVKQKVICLQSTVNKLKEEICRREMEKQQMRANMDDGADTCKNVCIEPEDPMLSCMGNRNTKTDQIERLKGSYLHLLTKYNEKECKLQELEKRIKGMCGSCAGGSGGGMGNLADADKAELQLLRVRVSEMKEEQVEFKCLMKEQSQQLEDYRNKYLVAQQRVEEQCVQLEKLNMNNRRIEKQVNAEIKEIRCKFQDKLNELLHFPKLLENEQIKLAQACKEKEELQSKLALVCKELTNLKSQLEQPQEDCKPQLKKCQLELLQVKNTLEEVTRQRDLYCEQLKTVQDDLDTLRSESAKIIARTKERAEMIKQKQNEHIDRLEKDLAQCRASACLSVSDREAVIREMQGQLNTLSYSFDAAQKQIKTLRNHVAYVSNENCFPVKC